jgi:hypothetical protein
MNEWVRSIGGMILTGEIWSTVLGEKPIPVPLCPPQISRELDWDRTRVSAVRGQWLTAWAMARPKLTLTWIMKFSTYRTVNTLLLGNKSRPINVIEGILAVCSESYTIYLNIRLLCGQNAEFFNIQWTTGCPRINYGSVWLQIIFVRYLLKVSHIEI